MIDEDRIARVAEQVDASLRRTYGDQVPMHYGTLMRWRLGGPDPLDGMSIYWHPQGHWHYVGFGLAEHGAKESPNADVSGWGFELTFRLRAPAEVTALADARGKAERAPQWPIVLLNDLARYVFETRRGFAHGHFLQRPGDPRGELWGIVQSPELEPICETANGKFRWLQLVALTEPEFRRLQGDEFAAFLADYARTNPCFVSDVTPEF